MTIKTVAPLVPRFGHWRRLMPSVGLLLRSLVAWRDAGEKRPDMTARGPTPRVPVGSAAPPAPPRPTGRRGPRRGLGCPRCRLGGPCALVGVACAPSCLRGCRGSLRPRRRRGGRQALARAGAHVLARGPYRVPVTAHQVVASSGRAGPAPGPGRRLVPGVGTCGGVRRRRSGPPAAPRPPRGQRAPGRSWRAQWCPTPSTPGARLPPSPMAHRRVRSPAARVGPTWVAAVGHRGTPGPPRPVPSNPTRACS